ncbi:HNH endonuclease [Yokenella regensburgei]|uniref:HNH endonuclease n=1 Tax=Yokenella regensburgei TaxID=158877 RepID=UPI003F15CCF1
MSVSRKENASYEEVASSFEYDPSTGLFYRKKSRGSYRGCWTKGSKHNAGYRFFIINGKRHLAHRIAFLLYYGCYPSGVIDHINGIKDDNRIENLRDVSQAENMKNQKIVLERKSKFSGCFLSSRKNKWRAEARINSKRFGLGTFETKEEAHEAYMLFMKTKFTSTN